MSPAAAGAVLTPERCVRCYWERLLRHSDAVVTLRGACGN